MVTPPHDNHSLVPLYLLISSFECGQMLEQDPCDQRGFPVIKHTAISLLDFELLSLCNMTRR